MTIKQPIYSMPSPKSMYWYIPSHSYLWPSHSSLKKKGIHALLGKYVYSKTIVGYILIKIYYLAAIFVHKYGCELFFNKIQVFHIPESLFSCREEPLSKGHILVIGSHICREWKYTWFLKISLWLYFQWNDLKEVIVYF